MKGVRDKESLQGMVILCRPCNLKWVGRELGSEGW